MEKMLREQSRLQRASLDSRVDALIMLKIKLNNKQIISTIARFSFSIALEYSKMYGTGNKVSEQKQIVLG